MTNFSKSAQNNNNTSTNSTNNNNNNKQNLNQQKQNLKQKQQKVPLIPPAKIRTTTTTASASIASSNSSGKSQASEQITMEKTRVSNATNSLPTDNNNIKQQQQQARNPELEMWNSMEDLFWVSFIQMYSIRVKLVLFGVLFSNVLGREFFSPKIRPRIELN